MSRRVIFARSAQRDIRRLTPAVAARVIEAINRFAETGHGDLIRLQGTDEEYRLRVGDWRVRLQIDLTNNIIEILKVLPRGRAYRD